MSAGCENMNGLYLIKVIRIFKGSGLYSLNPPRTFIVPVWFENVSPYSPLVLLQVTRLYYMSCEMLSWFKNRSVVFIILYFVLHFCAISYKKTAAREQRFVVCRCVCLVLLLGFHFIMSDLKESCRGTKVLTRVYYCFHFLHLTFSPVQRSTSCCTQTQTCTHKIKRKWGNIKLQSLMMITNLSDLTVSITLLWIRVTIQEHSWAYKWWIVALNSVLAALPDFCSGEGLVKGVVFLWKSLIHHIRNESQMHTTLFFLVEHNSENC